MVGGHHRLSGVSMSLSKLWELVMDRESGCAAVQGVTTSWRHDRVTELTDS